MIAIMHGAASERPLTFNRRIWTFLSAEKRTVAAITVYATATSLVSLAVPLAAQSLVTSVAATGLVQPVLVLTTAVFLSLCMVGVLSTLELVLTEHVLSRFYVEAANRFARAPELTPKGAAKFLDAVVVQKTLGMLLTEGPTLVLQVVVGLILLTAYHPLLLFFSLGFATTIGAFVMAFSGRGGRSATQLSAAKHATAYAIIQSITQGGGNAVQAAVDQWIGARRAFFSVVVRQTVVSYGIVAIASALFLAAGAHLVIEGQLSLGQLVAADIVVALLTQSLTKLPKLLETYYELGAAMEKLEHAAGPATVTPDQEPHPGRILLRGLVLLLVLAALALAFVPWQQTAFSPGRVIAYAPTDRQQGIEAPIEGRVLHWYVQEGQAVKAGDPLVDLTDNDPEILQRLGAERDAVERRLDATRRRTVSIEERIKALGQSRDHAVSAALSRVGMARQRVVSAERALEAVQATAVTTKLNIERQSKLKADGLASQRTVELAALDHQRAEAEVERAHAALAQAKDELIAIDRDRDRAQTDAGAQLGDARASLAAAEAELASASAELARMDVRLSRQNTQAVKAPRDGIVLRVIANAQGGAMVKAGDILATLVPATDDRAVELHVSGLDAPLVQVGQTVRVQFEGWPAVQFAGWPSIAIGTFGGRIALVDSASDEKGQLRVLIVPDENGWPEPRFLRQGVRAQGWVLLARVRLGFEVWRRLNGFAPALSDKPKEPAK